jgi:hypothetical protein
VRAENVVLSALCLAAVTVALTIGWRGRRLPLVGERPRGQVSSRDAAEDALRSLATVLGAGLIAGLLVVGLGGRLVMRILAATSGDGAQGLLTEAEETVGEITFGGSLGFVIFAGLLLPAAASLLYLVARRILPAPVWIGGSIFGLFLLATFGIDDPLSSDNVDFRILSPRPLAIALIILTALLFGVTFAALAARFDRSIGPITEPGWSGKSGYLSLIVLISPLFVVAIVYVAGRAIARGRIGTLLDQRPIQLAGYTLVVIASVAALAVVIRTATDIL